MLRSRRGLADKHPNEVISQPARISPKTKSEPPTNPRRSSGCNRTNSSSLVSSSRTPRCPLVAEGFFYWAGILFFIPAFDICDCQLVCPWQSVQARRRVKVLAVVLFARRFS